MFSNEQSTVFNEHWKVHIVQYWSVDSMQCTLKSRQCSVLNQRQYSMHIKKNYSVQNSRQYSKHIKKVDVVNKWVVQSIQCTLKSRQCSVLISRQYQYILKSRICLVLSSRRYSMHLNSRHYSVLNSRQYSLHI